MSPSKTSDAKPERRAPWWAALVIAAVGFFPMLFGGIEYGLSPNPVCQARADNQQQQPQSPAAEQKGWDSHELQDETKSGQNWLPCYRSHTAEEWIAIVTAFLAGFTWALATFTAWLWWDTRTALENEREAATEDRKQSLRAFITVHRPKIRVRIIDTIHLSPDKAFLFTTHAANVGDTNAEITQLGITRFVRNPKAVATFRADPVARDPTILLPPGNLANIDNSCDSLSEKDIVEINKGNWELCIYGTIFYVDGNGTKRFTGFLRVYDPNMAGGRFRRMEFDDPLLDLECED
jgi:hypothetical protein